MKAGDGQEQELIFDEVRLGGFESFVSAHLTVKYF
jgi:hypothetical protein